MQTCNRMPIESSILRCAKQFPRRKHALRRQQRQPAIGARPMAVRTYDRVWFAQAYRRIRPVRRAGYGARQIGASASQCKAGESPVLSGIAHGTWLATGPVRRLGGSLRGCRGSFDLVHRRGEGCAERLRWPGCQPHRVRGRHAGRGRCYRHLVERARNFLSLRNPVASPRLRAKRGPHLLSGHVRIPGRHPLRACLYRAEIGDPESRVLGPESCEARRLAIPAIESTRVIDRWSPFVSQNPELETLDASTTPNTRWRTAESAAPATRC